ncbi:MAG: cellulose binding domain-containing protein, partial [Pannonibacter phragmitetus]
AWGDGYVADLTVTAARTVDRWTVSWSSPGATSIVNAWGMDCRLSGSTITCTGAGWAAALAPGQTVRAGLQVASTRVPTAPTLTVTSS